MSASVLGLAPRTGERGHPMRMPLALVVGRYFVYILVGVLATVGLPLLLLTGWISRGEVLRADYGVNHAREVADMLAVQDQFDPSDLPSAYHYAHLTADGETTLATDMPDDLLARAREVARTSMGDASTAVDLALPRALAADSAYSLVGLERPDGTWVMLAYNLMPQWADAGARDTWPNPQDILVWGSLAATGTLVVLVALRASRVLTRKMAPLVAAAGEIGAGNLDFIVGSSNVAQIDDVLVATERMRRSLKTSLEEQWAADAHRREEVAALAHDLKTPLTVIRGNAELLGEDAATGGLDEGAAACVEAIHAASLRADGCVKTLIAASRDEGADESCRASVDLAELADDVIASARGLAAARRVSLEVTRETLPQARPEWDGEAIGRAVMNLIDNACDHATGTVELGICAQGGFVRFEVTDDGPGFSVEALAHARERLWRGDASRSGGGHSGLGLSIADDVARGHGGTLELANREGTSGARVTLLLPLGG